MIAQISIQDLDLETIKWIFNKLPISAIIILVLYNIAHLIVKKRLESKNIVEIMEESRRPCEERMKRLDERIDRLIDLLIKLRLNEAEEYRKRASEALIRARE